MPSWVLAIFLAIAALVPAGVYFTASFDGYNYSGYGTGGLSGAPGPLIGAGIFPALLLAGGIYYANRKSRRNPSGE